MTYMSKLSFLCVFPRSPYRRHPEARATGPDSREAERRGSPLPAAAPPLRIPIWARRARRRGRRDGEEPGVQGDAAVAAGLLLRRARRRGRPRRRHGRSPSSPVSSLPPSRSLIVPIPFRAPEPRPVLIWLISPAVLGIVCYYLIEYLLRGIFANPSPTHPPPLQRKKKGENFG